ncbi:MAG TPA: hypothetical protein VLQ93_12825, partial [Myxococcaceae bacterium]|nr:hypothetical protein [Myxococcaceae bacterium]
GRLYNYVVKNELAEKGGYESAPQYFSLHVKSLSKASLNTYGLVARKFSEAACARFGVHHLRLLLTYGKAAKLEIAKDDPSRTPIDVPREDGTVQPKPFAECTVEELRAALKQKKGQSEAPKPTEEPKPVEAPEAPGASAPLPEVDAVRLKSLRDSLSQHLPESTVRLEARVHQGQTFLSLQGVPMAALERFIEALVDGLLPMHLAQTTG